MSSESMKIFFLLFLGMQALLCPPGRADPDPLQDYCVADTSAPPSIYFNGIPCIPPAKAVSSYFATSALSKPGNTKGKTNMFGSNVTRTTVNNLPGVNTMGLTMARIDIDELGLVPPHTHPRASEVIFVLNGELLVGFVDTSNDLFTQRLRAGDTFIFPKGLVHFIFNLGQLPALAISGLNSQNPGTQLTSASTFLTRPELPQEVLKATFQIDGQEVTRIRDNLSRE